MRPDWENDRESTPCASSTWTCRRRNEPSTRREAQDALIVFPDGDRHRPEANSGRDVFVTVFRLHELAPTISSVIRPGLLTGPIGFALLLATHTYDTRALTADPTVRWVSAFVCWAILTVPFALFRGLAFEQVQVLLPRLLLVLSLSVIPATHRALDLVSEIFVSGGGLLGIAALLWGESSGGRLAVTSTLDPNDLGALMAMTLPFAMHRIASEKGLGRRWGFAVALVTLIVVAKTGSRGSTIALAFGAVIFAIASSARQRMVWIMSLAVCGLAGLRLAPSTFRERMSTLNSVESDYNATEYTGRTKIWARGITYAVENLCSGLELATSRSLRGIISPSMAIRGNGPRRTMRTCKPSHLDRQISSRRINPVRAAEVGQRRSEFGFLQDGCDQTVGEP